MAKRYYNGCRFESTIELKYALSIEDEYAYLLHPRRIFASYYRDNGKIVEINDSTKSYTPDFLIRSIDKNAGSIIETKPDNYNDKEQYEFRNKVIKSYLSSIEMELEFKWVYESDIHLTIAQTSKLNHILSQQESEKKFYYLLRKIYNRNCKVPFSYNLNCTDKEYINYVKYGSYPDSILAALEGS